MQILIKIILLFSILLNIVAVWGFFHFIKYGGSPLGEMKRMLTGNTHQIQTKLPYQDDNEKIKSALTPDIEYSERVVFFGASITGRWDFNKHLPNYKIINRGVGGQLAASMISRFKRDVIDLKPEAVIIKFCSINIRPHTPQVVLEDAMIMMTQLAKNHNITPIVSTIIPAGKPEAHIGDYSVVDSLRLFNNWVREFAQTNEYPIMDFAKAIEDMNGFLPKDCSVDPVHVNEKGYNILSIIVDSVLDKTLRINLK